MNIVCKHRTKFHFLEVFSDVVLSKKSRYDKKTDLQRRPRLFGNSTAKAYFDFTKKKEKKNQLNKNDVDTQVQFRYRISFFAYVASATPVIEISKRLSPLKKKHTMENYNPPLRRFFFQ